jgi:hypothetical protein
VALIADLQQLFDCSLWLPSRLRNKCRSLATDADVALAMVRCYQSSPAWLVHVCITKQSVDVQIIKPDPPPWSLL